jgi:protein-disulfide isomerase
MAKTPNKPTSSTPPPATGGRSAERRKERERGRQRSQLLIIAAVVGVFLLFGIVGIFLANQDLPAPFPDETATRYQDLIVNRNIDGFPRLGDPNAPVQIALYSAFDCFACRDFHDQMIDGLVQRVRDGGASLTFFPQFFVNDVVNGLGAAQASMCVAEQGKFWEFHDGLYRWVTDFGNQAFTNSRIVSGLEALNVDQGAYSGCLNSGRGAGLVDRASDIARALLNYDSPPAITVNGVIPTGDDGAPLTEPDAIFAAIDRAISLVRRNPTPTVESTAEVTPEITPEATMESTVEVTPDVTPESTETP